MRLNRDAGLAEKADTTAIIARTTSNLKIIAKGDGIWPYISFVIIIGERSFQGHFCYLAGDKKAVGCLYLLRLLSTATELPPVKRL
jgi:hypothetical protein